MGAVVRCGTLLTFLVFSGACGNADGPTAPSSTPSTPTPPPTPPPPAGQPPLTGPATTYLFFNGLAGVSPETWASRYVLYDNGAFALQYVSLAVQFPGSYRQEDGSIYFDFNADRLWDASGTLNDDLLEVRYSDQMQHSDFENAVYRRSQ